MKSLLTLVMAGLVTILFSAQSDAAFTRKQTEDLTQKLLKYYKDNGHEKTLAAINDKNGEFVKPDVYCFLFDYDVNTIAHGGNDKLIGKNLADLKDRDGKAFMKEMTANAKKGGGWNDYKWAHPTTKAIEPKSSYVLPVPGDKYYVGCGTYTPKE